MKRVLLFCDGTWNDRRNRKKPKTNVARLYEETQVAEHPDQDAHYLSGVGTEGFIFSRITGGAFATGLENDICEGYQWLAENWRDDDAAPDEIFIFGFSRGAYTARSIAGLIVSQGLLQLPKGQAVRNRKAVEALLAQARRKSFGGARRDWPDGVAPPVKAKVTYLGIWDTVGSLGVPTDQGFVKAFFDLHDRHQFADTFLNKDVLHARHALAMDERRFDFTPTLWRSDPKAGQPGNNNRGTQDWADVEQLWFAGAHSDVGGGRHERELADFTMTWVAEKAVQLGMVVPSGFASKYVGDISGDYLPFKEHSPLFTNRPERVRAVPDVLNVARVAQSAVDKHATSRLSAEPYWPTQRLRPSDAPVLVTVDARIRWNPARLYVEAGQSFEFGATGRWQDWTPWNRCGADGISNARARRSPGYLYGQWRENRAAMRRERHKDVTAKLGRRVPEANWFSLIGAVASGQGISMASATVEDHEMFFVGTRNRVEVTTSGYLYFFANDAPWMYFNNSGSVEVSIRRLG